MTNTQTKVKHERWHDEEGKFLDVYWTDKDLKQEAVIFGFNSKNGIKMTLSEMEEKGFYKE